jgi:hypothetical protein
MIEENYNLIEKWGFFIKDFDFFSFFIGKFLFLLVFDLIFHTFICFY